MMVEVVSPNTTLSSELPPNSDPPRPEGWMFVYDGGVLGAGATGAVRLPPRGITGVEVRSTG